MRISLTFSTKATQQETHSNLKKKKIEKMSVSTEWASTLPQSASAQCKNCARFSRDGETAGEAAAHCKKLSSFSVNSLCVCDCFSLQKHRVWNKKQKKGKRKHN